MGNQFNKQLCESQNTFDMKIPVIQELPDLDLDNIGELPDEIKENIQSLRPYEKQMEDFEKNYTFHELSQVKNQFYRGYKDEEGKPHKCGQIIFENSSIYIGQFEHGKAQPKGYYFLPDGSYYKGEVKDNMSCGEGEFIKNKFIYKGQFKENFFDGTGVLQVGNRYEFSGEFQKGRKKKGKLIWYQDDEDQQKCTYEGSFDEHQEFDGEGILRNNLGTYKGNFKNGFKEGDGCFQFSNGLLFEGKYVNGVKHGFGTIYNVSRNKQKQITYERRQNLIAYQGNFFKGLPNGKGSIYDIKLGKLVFTEWEDGVNKKMAY